MKQRSETISPQAAAAGRRAFDLRRIREDFPILQTLWHGRPLIYLDNAATTQKPRVVIDATSRYYSQQNANIHRGVYELGQVATTLYEDARKTVRRFINAAEERQLIFTRGTTEAINLVAATFGRQKVGKGDEIILTGMEHHSNIVPWQMLCEQVGAKIRVAPFNDAGELILEEYIKLFSPRTKLVAAVHVSNSLGTINPVKRMIRIAHEHGVPILIDGAQWVAHGRTDVQDLDCDFYAFSGHKLYGPTGIGVLYGKAKHLEAMPPYQGGGDMISSVTFEKTTYADLPNKFEAGTPNIAGAAGLAAAIDYLESVGLENAADHEAKLLEYATNRLSEIPGLRIVGTAEDKAGVISLLMEDPPISTIDLAMRLDERGIAVRAGHHCCQPVMNRFGIAGTTRMSFAMYNTIEEIDAAVEAMRSIRDAAVASRRGRDNAAKSDGASLQLQFPEPVADSPEAAADELAETFEMLGDRDTRNQYILELGEKLLPMPAVLKTEATRVHGCMSTVHLFGRKRPGTADGVDFLADSDAHIVRGLIGLLTRLFSGQPARQVLAFDVEAFFHRIGLDQFISSQRRNGLAGMVKRIRALAEQVEGEVMAAREDRP